MSIENRFAIPRTPAECYVDKQVAICGNMNELTVFTHYGLA